MLNSVWFDLDGTLLDTAADIKNAYRDMFAECGETVDLATLRIGPPLRQCILEVIPSCPDHQITGMINSFCQIYDTSGFPHTRFYDDIPEILNDLKSQEKLLFIATNKRLKPTLMLLQQFGIQSLFTGIYTPETFPGEKLPKGEFLRKALQHHELNPDNAIMIGDTASDIHAGKFAGMKTMAVTWGYDESANLWQTAPDYMVSTPSQLGEYI